MHVNASSRSHLCAQRLEIHWPPINLAGRLSEGHAETADVAAFRTVVLLCYPEEIFSLILGKRLIHLKLFLDY